jgi:hypothetical protein
METVVLSETKEMLFGIKLRYISEDNDFKSYTIF